MFWDNISSIFKGQRVSEDLVCLTLEAGTDSLSQNIVGKKLPIYTM